MRPDGVAVPVASTTRALDTELRLNGARSEEHRAPPVVRRGLVPRIRPGDEIRDAEPEDVDRARRLAAGRREVVRRRDLPAVEDDLAGRRGDRLRRRRLLARDAEVDLAPDVRVEVERLALHEARERVRARGDGLRLESLRGPARAVPRRRPRPGGSSRAPRRSRCAGTRPAGRARACRDRRVRRARGAPSCPAGSRAAARQWRSRPRLGRKREIGAKRQRALREPVGRAGRIDCGERRRSTRSSRRGDPRRGARAPPSGRPSRSRVPV